MGKGNKNESADQEKHSEWGSNKGTMRERKWYAGMRQGCIAAGCYKQIAYNNRIVIMSVIIYSLTQLMYNDHSYTSHSLGSFYGFWSFLIKTLWDWLFFFFFCRLYTSTEGLNSQPLDQELYTLSTASATHLEADTFERTFSFITQWNTLVTKRQMP